MPVYARILIPTDGSPLADRAVDRGLELAGALGAAVTVLTVVEPFHVLTYGLTGDPAQLQASIQAYEKQAAGHAASVLETAAAKAAAAGVQAVTLSVRSDFPSEAIVRTAEEQGSDLIVMASHGRRGVAALVLGSQTTKVLTHSKVPVLVLR